MRKYLIFALIVFVVPVAESMPVTTEFVTGSGFMRSSFGVSVQFDVDVNQMDPNDPTGSLIAAFFSFPQHLFMVFEATELESVAVDKGKRTALVTGTALVSDERSGFEGEVAFSAIFEDRDSRGNAKKSDRLSVTLHFPTGAETFSGGIVPGGIDVGVRRG